jgi:allophanate hydrolase subunit 2
MSKWPHTGIDAGGAVTEADLDLRQRLLQQWERDQAALRLRLQPRQPACIVDCAFCSGGSDCAQYLRDQRVRSAETERDCSTPTWRLLGRLIFMASAIFVIAVAFATF